MGCISLFADLVTFDAALAIAAYCLSAGRGRPAAIIGGGAPTIVVLLLFLSTQTTFLSLEFEPCQAVSGGATGCKVETAQRVTGCTTLHESCQHILTRLINNQCRLTGHVPWTDARSLERDIAQSIDDRSLNYDRFSRHAVRNGYWGRAWHEDRNGIVRTVPGQLRQDRAFGDFPVSRQRKIPIESDRVSRSRSNISFELCRPGRSAGSSRYRIPWRGSSCIQALKQAIDCRVRR